MTFRMFRAPTDAPDCVPMRILEPVAGARDPGESEGGALDLVIGAISGYRFDDIRFWVHSLERSGYAGERVIVAYQADFDTVDALRHRGFRVVTFTEEPRRRRFVYPVRGFRHEDTSIDRFHQVWRYLQMHDGRYRYVVSIDVRDVVFQRDPAAWLLENLGDKAINVGSEGLALADEPWNSDVVRESYGAEVHAALERRTVYNAGTVAGRAPFIKDLALAVFLSARRNRITYTDQAAMNVLLSLEPWRSITRFNRAGDSWACQAATMADPSYRAARGGAEMEPVPVLDGDVVRTTSGEPYCVVHQYDRIAEWKSRIEARYGT